MKFNGNPSVDLGLDYHDFSNFEKNGQVIIRYVLSDKLTFEKISELQKYENIKIVRDGATYRYAPEIKYDVLYISVEDDSEDESIPAEENLEDTDLESVDLEAKVNETDEFASLVSAITLANNLAVYYKELSNTYPDNSELFNDFSDQLTLQASQLQELVSSQPNVDPGREDSIANEEIVGGNKEEEAYNWVDSCFDEDSDLYLGDYEFDWDEYENRKKSSGYPLDLLNWITACLGEMSDCGYGYNEFISFFGHYPGEGNWESEEDV